MGIISNIEQHLLTSKEPAVPPYKCGFPILDEFVDGYVPGEFVVLSGSPKHGKSLLMKTFIRNFFEAGAFSLVFSYEEMPKQFYQGFPNGSQDLLFYVPQELKAFDIDWIKERIREAKEEVGISLVFIDHGHFLFDMSMRNNASLHIGDIARQLKLTAIQQGLVIFLIWHIQKGEIKNESDLDGSMLRDSGMLLGELDTLLFTFRQVKSTGLIAEPEYSSVVVDRTRRSGAFKQIVPIIKRGYYFEEVGGLPG